jgi:Asp-tRNA(Asn)/Glu-tRNA(Gln) amidotransferase A subunit family amidase
MSVPSGFSNDDVPTGIQIVGKSFSDKDVFNVAYVIESASNWYQANERPEI